MKTIRQQIKDATNQDELFDLVEGSFELENCLTWAENAEKVKHEDPGLAEILMAAEKRWFELES